jgi:hypothetical protein
MHMIPLALAWRNTGIDIPDINELDVTGAQAGTDGFDIGVALLAAQSPACRIHRAGVQDHEVGSLGNRGVEPAQNL